MQTSRLFTALALGLASFAVGCQGKIGETGGPGGGARPEGGNVPVTVPGLPCDVAALLSSYCVRCHSATPPAGVPMALVTLADLTAPARSNPGVSVANMALSRMQDATRPMPPRPATGPSPAEIAAFGAWIASGYAAPACNSGGAPPGSGTGAAAGAGAGGTGTGTGGAAGGASGGAAIGGGGASGAPSTAGAAGTPGGGTVSGVPCEVQAVFAARCTGCHGARPSGGAPMSLVTYADLTAPARSDPSRTAAQLAVARMQSAASPMPPPPAMRAAASEIAAVSSWLAAGYPAAGCGTGTGADGGTGTGADGGVPEAGASAPEGGVVIPDPFAVPPTCTSNTYWSSAGGSPLMNPGRACITCHRQDEGPSFTIAGTLYPTAHEPDRCNGAGAAGSAGARVVITAADGNIVTLTPNAAGNFYYQGAVATPFRARVTYMGRERAMGQAQTTGDCNSCHTQNGANQAPGRILLP